MKATYLGFTVHLHNQFGSAILMQHARFRHMRHVVWRHGRLTVFEALTPCEGPHTKAAQC
jgi:hypothetical protein